MKNVIVLDHPLVQHKLTLMRDKNTSTGKFRTLMREISILMGYEVTRNLPLRKVEIETPIAKTKAPLLQQKKVSLITILRAGNGLLDGFLQLMPTARVGHVGLYREASARSVVEYYFKLPPDMSSRSAIILDPMLATGQSAAACVSRLKQAKPKGIEFVCLVASPEGIAYLHEYHPDVTVYTAAIDKGLNEKKYIVPGLGDAGDRLFGTQ